MSFALVRKLVTIHRGRQGRGLSLIEVLIAIAITMAFLGGAVLAFVEIMRSTDRSQARLDAVSNARHALDRMSIELKKAYRGEPGPVPYMFSGQTVSLGEGDRADNDRDGNFDEEDINGRDDDADYAAATDDKHAELSPGLHERQRFVGIADLDDAKVDEDAKFTQADIQFRTFPDGSTTGTREVRYVLGDYDGENNVLLQEVTVDAGGPDQQVTTGPLAFNVVSFSALFWDQATTGTEPYDKYWKTQWDAGSVTPGTPELPVAVNLSVSVYAGHPQSLASVIAPAPIPTVTLSTTIVIEAVKGDIRYTAIRETY